MSEFQLKEGQGYIYVGEYFHKFGKEVPSEKKIGKTEDLLKIPQIDDYAFSLDFHTPDIYLVDDVEKMYKALKNNGLLTTYACRSIIIKNMQEAGFTTQKKEGAPGKREMLNALKYF